MKKPELLMPAGNLEKLEYAINYGADAVYLGVVDFSLRSMRKGELITFDNLKKAIDLAHELGAKAYLTLNIFAFNHDIDKLVEKIDIIKDANPDAIILSDLGVFNTIRKHIPNMPIHVSTQANSLNFETVNFWASQGAKRVILARELPVEDVKRIKKENPDTELEVFVHGAQCISFSGRCLLSDYMTGNERIANQGNCSQPCRWSYKLVEETRPGEYMEINQTDRGTHILSPKDLCLIEHLQALIDAGIDSFKIEGRTKSLYYVSAVTKAYRAAINEVIKNPNANLSEYFEELKKVGNRGYTQGFYFKNNNSDSYSYEVSKGLAGADFLFEVWNKGEDEGFYLVKIKNKVLLGDEIEIITPEEKFTTKVIEIKNGNREDCEVANTNDEIYMKFSKEPKSYKYAIARTIGIK